MSKNMDTPFATMAADFIRVASECDALRSDNAYLATENEGLRAMLGETAMALEKTALQFGFYAAQHLAKHTDDGVAKAKINDDWREFCLRAAKAARDAAGGS